MFAIFLQWSTRKSEDWLAVKQHKKKEKILRRQETGKLAFKNKANSEDKQSNTRGPDNMNGKHTFVTFPISIFC